MDDLVGKLEIEEDKTLLFVKEMLLTLASFSVFLSPLGRIYESISTGEELRAIKEEIEAIKRRFEQSNGLSLGSIIIGASASYLLKHSGFRRAKECLIVAEYLSKNTIEGLNWDPVIEYETAKDLLQQNGIPDPDNAWRLAVHELDRHGIIYVRKNGNSKTEFDEIGPNEWFFSRTDQLFQNWIPSDDAKSVIRLALDEDDRVITHRKVMEKYGWEKRRMNSALKFLEAEGIIEELSRSAPDGLWDYYCRLTNEADFFLEEG